MTRAHSFEKDTTYARLPNGMDVYVLPVKTTGFVSCTFCFEGGGHMVYKKQSVAKLFESMMPAGMRGKKRHIVREFFEDRGASVHVFVSSTQTFLSVRAIPRVFEEVCRYALTLFVHPVFVVADFKEAQTCLATSIEHAQEDTKILAKNALLSLWYAEGHPHWQPSLMAQHRELMCTTLEAVRSYQKKLISSIGSFVVVAGDIVPEVCIPFFQEVTAILPKVPHNFSPCVDMSCTKTPQKKDVVIYRKEKMNVDTLFGVPLALTKDDQDFHALSLAVAVLGGSSTGRLFEILRTKKSFTYGSYARLVGFLEGYTGMLIASAIFPNDVFVPAREAFRDVVRTWIERGITEKELMSRKEELAGSYVVRLASTLARKEMMVTALSMGRSLSYLDTHIASMQALTKKEVNKAIHTHINPDHLTSASSGSVAEV